MSNTTETVRASLKKRYAAEKRFRLYGMLGIGVSILFLFFLLISITVKAWPAFKQTRIQLTVELNAEKLGLSAESSVDDIRSANYASVLRDALYQRFPDVTKRKDKKRLRNLVSGGAQYQLQKMLIEKPELLGQTLTLWFSA
ncbi:MAG: DUF3333 domain-containing protein, partial [Gammaproteobacteria bacterium]|nr:DUF3333 domain-containing protein [Gammaproteobacteria bacterium]